MLDKLLAHTLDRRQADFQGLADLLIDSALLVDAFLCERQKAHTLEAQSRSPVSAVLTFTDTFRPRALENLRRVPDGYFSVTGELFKHLYNLEALLDRSLDEYAMIEISVGLRWSRYAREVLDIPDQHRCKYTHICQGERIEQMWAYALQYVITFEKWLWEVYFPQHFPEYERYRARYIGLPVPKTRKSLPNPMNRSQAVQPSFEWA